MADSRQSSPHRVRSNRDGQSQMCHFSVEGSGDVFDVVHVDVAMAESCQGQGCGFVEILGQVDMERWCVIRKP